MAKRTEPATRRRSRLGTRLVALVLLVTVPLAILSIINAVYDRQTSADDSYARTDAIVTTGHGVIDALVDQTDLLLTVIGRTTNASGDQCTSDLTAGLVQGGQYRNLYSVEADGTVACTALREPRQANVSDQVWFLRAMDPEFEDVALTAPAPGLTTGVTVMVVSHPKEVPVEGDEVPAGTVVRPGVLAASLDLTQLIDFTSQLTLPPESVIQVLDAEGRVLARSEDIDEYFMDEAPLFPRIEGTEKGNLEGRGVDGTVRLYSYQRIEKGGETLYLMAGITRGAAYADANRRLVWSFGIIVVLGIGVGLIALLAGRSTVVAPIERLRAAMAGFRAGDVTRRAGDVGGPAEIAELGTSFDAMADEIQHRLENQQRLLDQLEEASEAERQTIAAGIHDEVLQTLSAVGIRIQLLRRGADERQQAELDRAREMLDATAAQLRGLLFDLRPPEFDRIGLAATLRETLEVRLGDELDGWSVTGELGPDVPDQARILLYRIALQALANIRQHAGARRVDIRFATTGTVVTMEVSDDGHGFDVTRVGAEARPGHIGLQVMRDRAQAVGGEVTITSGDGTGTTVRADIPFRPEGRDGRDATAPSDPDGPAGAI